MTRRALPPLRVCGGDRGVHALPLADSRTQVVFGSGKPDAELMLVGEAPGFHEDQLGLPFAGQAGALLGTVARGHRPRR